VEDTPKDTTVPDDRAAPPGNTPTGTTPPVDVVPESGVGGTIDSGTIVSGEKRADRSLRSSAGAVPTNTRVAARPLAEIDPVYPLSARRRGIEGEVIVEAVVSVTGTVTDASVIRSSRNRRLDEAAVAAVAGTPFSPAHVGTVPREGTTRVRIVFTLD
jgi:protein TonB